MGNACVHRLADNHDHALRGFCPQRSRADQPVAPIGLSGRLVQYERRLGDQPQLQPGCGRGDCPGDCSGIKNINFRWAIESERAVVENAGILLSYVVYTKQSSEKRFLIQNAAMNYLIRPALHECFIMLVTSSYDPRARASKILVDPS